MKKSTQERLHVVKEPQCRLRAPERLLPTQNLTSGQCWQLPGWDVPLSLCPSVPLSLVYTPANPAVLSQALSSPLLPRMGTWNNPLLSPLP